MDGQVSENTKKLRTEKMIEIGRNLKKEYFEKYIGSKVSVLVERKIDENTFEGHTANFIQVIADGNAEEGCFADVILKGYSDDCMTGEMVW